MPFDFPTPTKGQIPYDIPSSICKRAEACLSLLCAVGTLPLKQSDRRRSEMAHRRFKTWGESLDVWENKRPNLDALLDASKNTLRCSIEARVDSIKEHLVPVLRSGTMKEIASETPQNHFDTQFTKFETGLTELQNFTNRLLIHTKAGLGHRVADYRKRHEDRSFDKTVMEHLQNHFPYLEPKIPSRASPWWERFGMKWLGFGQSVPPAVWSPVDRPAGLFKALADAVLFAHYKALYERDCGENERIQARDPEVASTRLPVENSSDLPTCPICPEVCSESSFGLKPDMRHLLHMVKPYVCLAGRCSRLNPPSFETAQEWKDHMQSYHGSDWVSHFQKNVQWICPECRSVSLVEFESVEWMAQDLVVHMQTHHGKKDDEDTLSLARLSRTSCPRPQDTCPICGTCYRACISDAKNQQALHGQRDDEIRTAEDCIAKHMLELSQKFTFPRVKFLDSTPSPRAQSCSTASSPEYVFSDLSTSVVLENNSNQSPSSIGSENFPHKADAGCQLFG